MRKVIDYFYAPISGYAYLGEQRLVEIAERYDAKIQFKPIDIAMVFSSSNTTAPFKQSSARLNYRLLDLKRLADKFSLPIHPKPEYWPVPLELAATTIYAVINLGGDPHKISFAILSAVYAEQKNVSEIETIRAILKGLAFDADKIIEKGGSDEIYQQYTAATQEAIDLGVFGSPSYVYKGEIFFGQDRLDMLVEALGQS